MSRSRIPAPKIGEQFGKWRVMSGVINSAHAEWMVSVRCDCGFDSAVRIRHLRSGLTARCAWCANSRREETIDDKRARWRREREDRVRREGGELPAYSQVCVCGKELGDHVARSLRCVRGGTLVFSLPYVERVEA